MDCPTCGYVMDEWSDDCPRCRQLGAAAVSRSGQVLTGASSAHGLPWLMPLIFVVALLASGGFFAAFFFSRAPRQTPPPPPPQHAEQAEQDFAITFPDKWLVYEVPDTRAKVMLLAKEPDNGQQQGAHFLVKVYESQTVTLDTYYENMVAMKRAQNPKLVIRQSGRMESHGVPMRWLIFDDVQHGNPLRIKSYLAVKGNRQYLLFGNAHPQRFARYAAQFDRIAGSFRFK